MTARSAHLLMLMVVGLCALGIVMLTSLALFSGPQSADAYFEVKRQGIFLFCGLGLCGVMALIDYRWWLKLATVGFVLSCLLLAAVFVLGKEINGSKRWIEIGSTQVQPSEFARFGAVVFLAAWFHWRQADIRTFKRGFLYPGLLMAIPGLLIACEVDLGTSIVLCLAVLSVFFVAGVRWFYVLPIVAAIVGSYFLLIHAAKNEPEWIAALDKVVPGDRVERVVAFTDLEAHKHGAGLQQYRSWLAHAAGGISGLGIGEGRQKMFYLPFAHTDFIFPMIGEELGLIGALSTVLAFALILYTGVSVAAHAPDAFGRLLGIGIVSIISLEAALNIGVTTSVLPNTGLPLPFISYGGSSLLASLGAVGVLLNIYRQAGSTRPAPRLGEAMKDRVTPRI